MRRSRVAALLTIAGLAVLALLAARRSGTEDGVGTDGDPVRTEGADAGPSEVDAPALSAAPPRPPAPRPTAPGSDTDAADDGAPAAPAGAVTVRLELPSPADEGLAQLPVRAVLRFSGRHGGTYLWGPPQSHPVLVDGEPDVEWLVPMPVAPGGTPPAWRVSGLPVGEWCVSAEGGPVDNLDRGTPPLWGPALARLSSGPTEVTLPLWTPANSGTLRLTATERGAVSNASFRVAWRGHGFAEASSTEVPRHVELRVPAGEDLVVEARSVHAPRAGALPPRTVRVAAGAVEEVVFELAPLVPVTLRVLRPGGEPAPRASIAIWRVAAGGPEHVLTEHDVRDAAAGTPTSVLATGLSAGDYRALVAGVRPYAPVWHPFHVHDAGPQTVEVRLDRTGPEASFLVQRADGAPASGYGLWLGRLDGPSPEHAVTGLLTTDESGRANPGPLADGEYLVADYGHSVWRTIRVDSGAVEPPVVRLPTVGSGGEAHLRGRVRGPTGAVVASGLVSVGRPGDWLRYTHFRDGRFDLKAPAGDGVLTVHHTWYALDRFAAWSRPVVVEAGKDQAFDVRLRGP